MRPTRAFNFLAACAIASGCGLTDIGLPRWAPDDGVPAPDSYGYAWTGTFVGVGSGVVSGAYAPTHAGTLTVRLDADSVRSDECVRCVTIQLDTLFALANVALLDPVRMEVEYTRDGMIRRLEVDRFSAGGFATANVLLAHLTVRPAEGGNALTDISFLLEER